MKNSQVKFKGNLLMQNIKNVSGKIILLSVLFAAVVSVAAAQSGRSVSDSQKANSSTPENNSTKSSDQSAPKSVVDSKADKYKLIFPIRYTGDIKKDYKYMRLNITLSEGRSSFLEELNRVGAEGYKFAAADHNYSAALVKLDEGQYEYRHFETESNYLYSKNGFKNNHETLIGQGFRFVQHSMLLGYCQTPENSFLEECEYQDLFLYEKEKNGKSPLPYSVFGSIGGWKNSPELEMGREISEKMADDYLPVAAFSAFEILLQKTSESDALLADLPEIKVVRSLLWRKHLSSKVNELAQQGYRLGVATSGIVIMYRHKNETAPVSYVWLQTKGKNFEKELAKLAAQGAIYRATYPTDGGDKKTLIFEVPQTGITKKREYRVLRFDFEIEQNSDTTISRKLTPESDETLKTLNKLAREGFIARDVFYSDKTSVLLERESK